MQISLLLDLLLHRLPGAVTGARLDPNNYPTLESVVTAWASVETYVREFFATLTEADLARVVEFGFKPGEQEKRTVAQLLQHGANHAVHHRGQVALLMRMLGHAPGDVDLLYFDAAK